MYPTKYANIGKHEFLNTDVSTAAIILFIPKDGSHDMPESYPEGYIPTLKAHAETAVDVLYIEAEDVGTKWGKNFIAPKVRHLHEIDSFLKKNAGNPVLAVCDAGVSRSGFVTFYLSVKNDKLEGVHFSLESDGDDPHFIRGSKYGKFFHTNPALTKYLLDSNLLTHSERKKLNSIMLRDDKPYKDDDLEGNEWLV